MYSPEERSLHIQSNETGYVQLSSSNTQLMQVKSAEQDAFIDVPIDSSDSQKTLLADPNGLEELYDYFIKEKYGDPIPFDTKSKVGLFLEGLGGTGGIYAWPPAWEFSKNKAPWIRYSFAISNPISNALFLMKATDDLLDKIQAEISIPKELKALINSPTKKELLAKYLKMTLGSLVCVVPFSIAVYLFPIPGCTTDWCLGLTVSHSTLSNTILHGISWGIILTPTYWYYRLPVLPFEKLYSFIKSKFSSSEELQLVQLMNEQQVVQAKYKDQLVSTFNMAANKIIRGRTSEGNLGLNAIQQDNASLVKFVELANKNVPALPEVVQQQSYFRKMIKGTHHFLSNGGISFLGAGIMVVGCIGWIANPIYIGVTEHLGLAASTAIGSLPTYSTAVLCAFYGTAIFNQIYSYFTTWNGSARDKIAPEVQMYPKTFALFTLANIYVSFFAFATGTQLIKTVFADEMWDDIRPTLEGISIPTLQILSFIPLMDLFCLVVRKGQAKFGSLANDDTLAARLLVKMSSIVHYLQQMKGDELMLSISKYTPQQQQALGISPEQFQQDFRTFFELKEQIEALQTQPVLVDMERPKALPSTSSNRYGFLGSKNTNIQSESTALREPGKKVPSYQ